jgi:predicted 3-demethylubiquinone-9 3-methyltransferase (glyoxalase superfamily)
MPRITPCLWFDTQAEEAARFYVSIFQDSRVVDKTCYGDAGPGPKGRVLTVRFRLDGQEFIGLNGGPRFPFTEAISLTVNCETQKDVDRFWKRLTDGGQESQCGWLKDRFGLSWQVVPTILPKMLRDKDPARRARVMEALLLMKKFDIAALKRAYAGGPSSSRRRKTAASRS